THIRIIGPPAADAAGRRECREHDCRHGVDANTGRNQLHSVLAALAKWRNLSGLRTTYSARMTSPSISNAAVWTTPSGASTMTAGRPLTVAKRTVKSWRHH